MQIGTKHSLLPAEITIEIETNPLEFINYELTYLAELEILVLVLSDMQRRKTDPDKAVPLFDQLRCGRDKYFASNIHQTPTGLKTTSSRPRNWQLLPIQAVSGCLRE